MTLDEIPERLNILGAVFDLFACIQYIGDDEPDTMGHYVSHIRRRNNCWKLYDDLKTHISNSKTHIKMNVQVLFYVQATVA